MNKTTDSQTLSTYQQQVESAEQRAEILDKRF